jgi:hypothetical protein
MIQLIEVIKQIMNVLKQLIGWSFKSVIRFYAVRAGSSRTVVLL